MLLDVRTFRYISCYLGTLCVFGYTHSCDSFVVIIRILWHGQGNKSRVIFWEDRNPSDRLSSARVHLFASYLDWDSQVSISASQPLLFCEQ